jgi:hypothetical protein
LTSSRLTDALPTNDWPEKEQTQTATR